jgi:hypothetical protein
MIPDDTPNGIGKILLILTDSALSRYATGLPDSYVCYDTETDGCDSYAKLVEWGHVVVKDRKVVSQTSVVLNWYSVPGIDHRQFTNRLLNIQESMRDKGKTWRLTPDYVQANGVNPHAALKSAHNFLVSAIEKRVPLVTHNGWAFDLRVLSRQFADFLDVPDFTVPPDAMLDTGVIEKASQLSGGDVSLPRLGERFDDYARRIVSTRAKGVYWSLDRHCIEKYALASQVDQTKMHSADNDAYVVHLLVEKWRTFFDAERQKHAKAT